MQDVNYEVIYEPGKDKADLLDRISRHSLNQTTQHRENSQVDY